MTNIRVWLWTGVILAAFVIGAMLASDSISFAQEDSPTSTPVATESTGATPTPAPSDDSSDDRNCPDKGTDDGATDSGTSTSGA